MIPRSASLSIGPSTNSYQSTRFSERLCLRNIPCFEISYPSLRFPRPFCSERNLKSPSALQSSSSYTSGSDRYRSVTATELTLGDDISHPRERKRERESPATSFSSEILRICLAAPSGCRYVAVLTCTLRFIYEKRKTSVLRTTKSRVGDARG